MSRLHRIAVRYDLNDGDVDVTGVVLVSPHDARGLRGEIRCRADIAGTSRTMEW